MAWEDYLLLLSLETQQREREHKWLTLLTRVSKTLGIMGAMLV